MKTKGREQIRNLALSGMFIAIGVALPMAFHSIQGAGSIFQPMALPILIAALLLPWQYTIAIGAITPLLSSFFTGMPPLMPTAIIMSFEYITYGLVISLLKKKLVKNEKVYTIYLVLVPALILGRIVNGFIYMILQGSSMWVYIWGAVVKGLPGTAIQLVLVPILYKVLVKALPNLKEE